MKTKLYLDITNLMQVEFLTGIQRVVREIAVRFLKDDRLDIVLLAYSDELAGFEILDGERFFDFFTKGQGMKANIRTGKECPVDAMESGAIFYDMDSAWHSKQKRSKLLPAIRNKGLKLAVYLYDIIPVLHPEYVHQNTIVLFMEYLGAYLKNADIIIASTQATLEYIQRLTDDMGLQPIPGFVSWLGVDFANDGDEAEQIREDAKRAAERKYVLMVGTLEPRKNHKLVLDAFDHGLFELGYRLVFAGHFGWDVEELKQRVLGHPLLGKQLFYIENANNVTIDYLYRNAYMVAFPSFAEGFGLPVIEALGRGIPVIASNYNVIFEVGNGYAEFFSPQDETEFIRIFRKYHDDSDLYVKWKEHISSYQPFSWEQAEEKIVEALTTLKPSEEKANVAEVKQMVMLSARTEDLLNTLPFVEKFMPFIKEIVICCPDQVVESIQESYTGKIKINFLPDSKVLAGRPLPKEHQPRNFFLRCMLMRQGVLDDVFIMSDDDYRPLYPITQDVFFDKGKYRGFYFYEMHEWRGCQGALTSFDKGIHKTLKFCEENKYPTMQFNAHIPQIIEKKVFNEMVDAHPGIEKMGFDEWSTYFNYMMAHYPYKVIFCKYKTMNWPGSVTDWSMYCQPEEFVFENYYNYLYSAKGLFAGIEPDCNENILENNKKKVELVLRERTRYNNNRKQLEAYNKNYRKKYGEAPIYCITNIFGRPELYLPKEMEFVARSCNRIDISILGVDEWKSTPDKLKFAYYYTDRIGREIGNGRSLEAETCDRLMEVPFVAPYEAGKYTLCCEIKVDQKTISARTELYVKPDIKMLERKEWDMEEKKLKPTSEVVSILTRQPAPQQSRRPMELQYYRPLRTNNKLKALIQKVVEKMCSFLMVPIVVDQNAINSNLARQIEELQKKNRQMEEEIKELRKRV